MLNMLKTTPEYLPYYNRIVRYVQKILPYFADFAIDGFPEKQDTVYLFWKKQGSDYILTPNQLSDGTIRFIALATLLLAPRKIQPDVIVIDEPELGLHPFAIRILANMIKQAAENLQILVATQSPSFLDFFDANDVLVFEAPNEITTVKRLNQDELSSWAQEYTLSELRGSLDGEPL